MSDYIQVRSMVPDFKLETFEPSKGDFGEVSLETLKANKKWTILLFYPADFTFV
jgi:peroxiredoxin (alkyl hydroperoxide reductase subunit C)